MLGTGRAVAIVPRDYAVLAAELGCEPAVLEAIAKVESKGFGWFPDGRIKILFEKHWLYKLLPAALLAAAVKAKLARKDWISPKDGGYKEQASAQQRYDILAAAIALHPEAAYQSISVGTYQIMGFNHDLCGYPTAKAMFDAFCDSEANQLKAFARFLKGKKLIPALIARDFDRIETVYNGGGQNGAYAKEMLSYYAVLAKDTQRYSAQQAPRPAMPAPTPTHPTPTTAAPAKAPPKVGALWAGIAAIGAALVIFLRSKGLLP